MILLRIKEVLEHNAESIAAFTGGSGFALFAWMHVDPAVLVGQVFTTFLLGAVGGIGGLIAKAICNRITGKSKRKKPTS